MPHVGGQLFEYYLNPGLAAQRLCTATGNKCLPGITVIGSLNASGKPFKMRFVFCTTANKQEFTHRNAQTIDTCPSLSELE